MSDYTHFWLSMDPPGFWPVSVADGHEPTAVFPYKASGTDDSPVMLGCRDGYIRRHDQSQATDDGTAFDSYVYFGPFRLGGDTYRAGVLKEVKAALSQSSGNVTWEVMAGKLGEDALDASQVGTGTWSTGLNYASHPRRGGGSFVLKVKSITGQTSWSLEWAHAVMRRTGKQRRI